MKRRLLKWLVCPLCQSKVNLVVEDSERRPLSGLDYLVLDSTAKIESCDEIETEVITGALTCGRCHVYYPIFDAIPRMLT